MSEDARPAAEVLGGRPEGRAIVPGVLVVGFGNTLSADDGAGPAVVAAFAARGLPDHCRVEEGGTDALLLTLLWRGEREIWLVDALVAGAVPGTVRRLEHEEVMALPQPHGGAHQLSLPASLRCVALAEPAMARVRYRLWGIEPLSLAPFEPMCEAVALAAREVAAEIGRALEEASAAPSSR
jgi:hydrogenase maturation protease